MSNPQITAAKLKQKEEARRRSKQAVRQTSQASVSNAPSQVTQTPPQVYQVPQINIPTDLHEVARLMQGELSKVAQSQSIILTLWQAYQQQKAELASMRQELGRVRNTAESALQILSLEGDTISSHELRLRGLEGNPAG